MTTRRRSRPSRHTMDILIFVVVHLLGIQARQPARVRPPIAVECPRNQLTAYTGRVTSWSRRIGQTSMTIETDWDTTEVLTLKHPGTDDAREFFLVSAGPFHSSDWPRIESGIGRLREEVRATAWVCDDGRQPIIDWQPPPK